MSKRDYYEILGVAKTATDAETKAAFRKLAMDYHPDRNQDNPEAEAKFKELGEAYEVLKDKDKRAAYDRYGHAAFEGGRGPGSAAGGFGPDFGSAFSDIFDDLFGEVMGGRGRRGGGGRGGRSRGADLRYNMDITLEDAFNGKDTKIRVPTTIDCERCESTGAEPGSKPTSCGSCHGSGKVRASQGFFTIERTCPHCGGTGRKIENPCRDCGGAGRKEKEQNLAVSIPEGVEDGTRIRLGGKGQAGMRGGPAGDLYLFLSVSPHEIFEREGPHLFLQMPIPFTTAALGGDMEVPTMGGGKARVSIPHGTQTGAQFRLRAKGMPVLQQNPHQQKRRVGDMIVEVMVEVPAKLNSKQKDALKAFQDAEGDKAFPEFAKFKKRLDGFLKRAAE